VTLELEEVVSWMLDDLPWCMICILQPLLCGYSRSIEAPPSALLLFRAGEASSATKIILQAIPFLRKKIVSSDKLVFFPYCSHGSHDNEPKI
jgi:hypothetical protein